MDNKQKENKFNNEIEKIEDCSKYGEFISSFFTWDTLDGQKKKVKRLENITENKNDK